MSTVIDWNNTGPQGGGQKGDIRNLKLESEKRYEIRFVGHPIQFYTYFNEVTRKSARVKDAKDNPIFKKYGIEAKIRYAANVLDRADGLCKVMEFPQSVYNDVRDWGVLRKSDPGGKAGCNFAIGVTGQKKKTRYKTVGLDITPFTEAEKEYLRANMYDLAKLYKPYNEDEVDAHLGYAGGGQPAKEEEDAPVSAPTGGQDLPF